MEDRVRELDQHSVGDLCKVVMIQQVSSNFSDSRFTHTHSRLQARLPKSPPHKALCSTNHVRRKDDSCCMTTCFTKVQNSQWLAVSLEYRNHSGLLLEPSSLVTNRHTGVRDQHNTHTGFITSRTGKQADALHITNRQNQHVSSSIGLASCLRLGTSFCSSVQREGC